jgi:Flp pilus assembly protein TadG
MIGDPMKPRISWQRFSKDIRGTSAVEFAVVSLPFIFLILMILQMAAYYMAQSSLDAGTIRMADELVNLYNSGTTPTYTASALNAKLSGYSGGLIKHDGTFLVDLKRFSNLSAAPVAISNAFDTPVPNAATTIPAVTTVYALRAQGTIVTFMPGFQALATVRSSALVRLMGS